MSKPKRYLLFFFVSAFLITGCIPEYEVSSSKHPFGKPIGTITENIEIDRDLYAMSYNRQTKMADWVAYRVATKNFDCDEKRTRYWKSDPDLPEPLRLFPKDYKGVGEMELDRGHQAPLGSFKCTEEWKTTNYLSNITPQRADLNRGSWKFLEAAIRKLSEKGYDIWVITGPYYDNDKYADMRLPSSAKVYRIPSGYWKVIIGKKRELIKTAAFMFSQDVKRKEKYSEFKVSIDDIEKKSGLNLYPMLNEMYESDININWFFQ